MFAQVGSEVQLDRSTNDSRLVSGLARLYDRIDRPHGACGYHSLGVVGPRRSIVVVKSLQNLRLLIASLSVSHRQIVKVLDLPLIVVVQRRREPSRANRLLAMTVPPDPAAYRTSKRYQSCPWYSVTVTPVVFACSR